MHASGSYQRNSSSLLNIQKHDDATQYYKCTKSSVVTFKKYVMSCRDEVLLLFRGQHQRDIIAKRRKNILGT